MVDRRTQSSVLWSHRIRPVCCQRSFVAAILLSVLVAANAPAAAGAVVTSPLPGTPLTVDGKFGGGVDAATGEPLGEWSDATSVGFVSPDTSAGTLLSADPADANALSVWPRKN